MNEESHSSHWAKQCAGQGRGLARRLGCLLTARSGRIVALEIMVPTPAIRNLIREDKVHQIYSSMQAGQEKAGMQTMNQCLATLVQRRQIRLDEALATSSLKEELTEMINRGMGVVAGAGMGRPGMPPPARR